MRQLLAQETLETLEPLEPLVVAQETSVSHWSRSLGDASCASYHDRFKGGQSSGRSAFLYASCGRALLSPVCGHAYNLLQVQRGQPGGDATARQGAAHLSCVHRAGATRRMDLRAGGAALRPAPGGRKMRVRKKTAVRPARASDGTEPELRDEVRLHPLERPQAAANHKRRMQGTRRDRRESS